MKTNFYFLLVALLFSKNTFGQFIFTVAGNGISGYAGDRGPATMAELNSPSGIALDTLGYIYISDGNNNRVRKINTSGIITTIAGTGTGGFGGDGGPATSALLHEPEDIAIQTNGNIYLIDKANSCVRKIDTLGIITTVAGTPGIAGYSGDGGPATLAQFNGPQGVAVDELGNIFITDEGNNCIRKVNTSGIINTIVGIGVAGFSGDGGPATLAEVKSPNKIIVDASGNIYFTDLFNYRIRKVNTSGIITTIAGNGTSGFLGDGGPATAAEFNFLWSLALDNYGNLFVEDQVEYRIRKINTSGIINTIAGTGIGGYSGDGCPASAAELSSLNGLAVDRTGKIFCIDAGNSVVRMIKNSSSSAYFTGGAVQSISVCEGSIGNNIDTLLTVMDSIAGRSVTWSPAVPPAHGIASVSYTSTSTGLFLTTSGLTYTPIPGYSGTDSFSVVVSDCADQPDTTKIIVTVSPPPTASAITGADSVCVTFSTLLNDSTAGGIWLSGNAHATISGGTVSGISAGLDTLFYIVSNSCGADTVKHVMSVTNCISEKTGNPGIQESKMIISPNPNDGVFSLLLTSGFDEPVDIVITNIIGEKVADYATVANKMVDIKLPKASGVYFLSATTFDGRYNANVIVR